MQEQRRRRQESANVSRPERLADRLDRLSLPLAENVIRRAIELHHDQEFEGGTIDVATVEQIAGELGIGPEMIRRALLDELQTERHDDDGLLDRLLGPDRVTGGLVTKSASEDLDRQVEEWMRRHEGMRPRAKNRRAVRWERDPGIGSALRRGFKRAQGTGALRTWPQVTTRQTEVGHDEQLIEIEADTSKVKAESAGVGAATAFGAVAIGAAVAAAGTFAPDVVEFLTGFLPALGGAILAAGAYARSRISRTKDGINRALDGIVHPHVVRRNADRRERGSRKPTWAHIVEEIVDEIFD